MVGPSLSLSFVYPIGCFNTKFFLHLVVRKAKWSIKKIETCSNIDNLNFQHVHESNKEIIYDKFF
jgi:hypothetical protein